MRNETPVTMVGTLVRTGEVRRVGEDQSVVLNLRVASNERRFDKISQQWVDGDSLYLSVSCWRQLAENVSSLVKGDPVIVSGKLRGREWTTEQGERRSVVEIEATAIGPDLARCTVSGIRRPRRGDSPASGADGDGAGSEGQGDGDREPAVSSGPERDTGLDELADSAHPLVGAMA